MANEGLCKAMQASIDALQDVVDEVQAGECDVESMWREVDRVCQEIAYLSEGTSGEDDDELEQDDDGGEDEELDFDDDSLADDADLDELEDEE